MLVGMAFTPEDIRANGEFFAAKLRAERQLNDVIKWSKGESGAPDFVLVDVRGRGGFAKAHIQGAVCVPLDEIAALAEKLPRDRELVTYCWNST
jgi:rhodanese-related sulfurtransferase